MGVKAEGILRVCQGESSNFRIAVSGAVRVSEQFVGCNRGAFAIAMSHGSAAVGVWTHKGCWPGGCRTTCRGVAVIINKTTEQNHDDLERKKGTKLGHPHPGAIERKNDSPGSVTLKV